MDEEYTALSPKPEPPVTGIMNDEQNTMRPTRVESFGDFKLDMGREVNASMRITAKGEDEYGSAVKAQKG